MESFLLQKDSESKEEEPSSPAEDHQEVASNSSEAENTRLEKQVLYFKVC